jgi:AbrB family looped-hinge helix DNA binding protein
MGVKKIPLETTVIISSKGQVVIPKELRNSANLHEGEKMLIRVREDNVIELVPLKKDIDDLFKIFPIAYEKNRIEDDELIKKYFEENEK